MNTLKTLRERAKKLKTIELEEGVNVHIRKLTAAEVTAYVKLKKAATTDDDEMNAVATLIVAGTCEDDGRPAFQNSTQVTDDIDSDTATRLAKEIITYSGIGQPESEGEKKPDSPA